MVGACLGVTLIYSMHHGKDNAPDDEEEDFYQAVSTGRMLINKDCHKGEGEILGFIKQRVLIKGG